MFFEYAITAAVLARERLAGARALVRASEEESWQCSSAERYRADRRGTLADLDALDAQLGQLLHALAACRIEEAGLRKLAGGIW